MGGFTFTGGTLDPGTRSDRVDAGLLADAREALSDAPLRFPWFSLQVVKTEGKAGSDGYAYRDRLLDEGIPVRSVVKTAAAAVAIIDGFIPPVPPLKADATAKQREAHTKAVAKRADIIPAVYRDAAAAATEDDPGWTWLLVRVDKVTRTSGGVAVVIAKAPGGTA